MGIELNVAVDCPISAITILSVFQLDHLWVDTWRELDAKRARGEDIEISDQFDILQRLAPEISVRFSY